MERVTVRMARSDRLTPWGFGVTEAPDGSVVIVNVIGGSLADRAGLRNGDVIDKLEELDNLDINAVDRLLVTAHEKIELVVTRASGTSSAHIWRPEITANQAADERPFSVNLQHNSDTRPPQGFNSSALPFETDSRVKHIQYNSPLGLYSEKNAAEQYVQQTEGFVDNQSARASVLNQQEQPAYLRSETLRLLKEQEQGRNGATTLSNHPNPSGLPVCFICTRPILGVMARAAGKDLHGDCLSCATCGNSLRNVGHHFIEDKFYCDIHGSQRKAGGGRPGMDPNIFVKSSPTSAQPTRQQHEAPPQAAYQPQVNQHHHHHAPYSASPITAGDIGGGNVKQVTTHYHTPKTQGILSPGQRGVPSAHFGADLQKTVSYGAVSPGGTNYDRISPAPSQYSTRGQPPQQQYHHNPPPPPLSNPPQSTQHESRIPDSIRSAVSPRRSGKSPRQWPPPISSATQPNRYWQIDAADTLKKSKPNYGEDLATMIKECENEKEPKVVRKEPANRNVRMNGRRASNISKEQVNQAFEEQRKRTLEIKVEAEKNQEINNPVQSKVYHSPNPERPTILGPLQAPEIRNGIHWTVIHSPNSTSPAKVSAEAAAPTDQVLKPIATRAIDPKSISKTSIPKPFGFVKTESESEAIPVTSYIVKNTFMKTTASEPYTKTENLLATTQNTTDSSTSPIPTIRLSRKPAANPVEQISMATSPIKINEPKCEKEPMKQPKKVDFSQNSPVIIPEWKNVPEIIDESDILTEASREEDSISLPRYLKTTTTYDGDESELVDNKSDTTSLLEDDEEEWRKIVPKKATDPAEEQWRQRAMSLLEDDDQTERDLMIVAALNERLQGLREMEDEDRLKAIECIARHQSELEQTQTQLSTLLESAIVYLSNLRSDNGNIEPDAPAELSRSEKVELALQRVLEQQTISPSPSQNSLAPPVPPERKVFPFERDYSPVATQSLHDVLDEFNTISRRPTSNITNKSTYFSTTDAVEDSRNFLASRLEQYMNLEDDLRNSSNVKNDNGTARNGGSTYTKSSFEKTSTQQQHIGGGGAPTGNFHGTTTTTPGAGNGGWTTSSATTQVQQSGGKIPYCEACKQQIRGAFVLATGKSWCPEHFVCANSTCRRRLLECGFVEEDGQKFCETCFEQHIAPRCAKCSKPIVSDCLNALQKKWHPTCFTCAHCQKPFGNSAFYLEQGLPYCEEDWNALFTTKCISCRYPIEAGDRWVEALGNAFHSNCFTCARCHHNLEGESFFAKNGQPFCKLHA